MIEENAEGINERTWREFLTGSSVSLGSLRNAAPLHRVATVRLCSAGIACASAEIDNYVLEIDFVEPIRTS